MVDKRKLYDILQQHPHETEQIRQQIDSLSKHNLLRSLQYVPLTKTWDKKWKLSTKPHELYLIHFMMETRDFRLVYYFLLQDGIDVNVTNHLGETALMYMLRTIPRSEEKKVARMTHTLLRFGIRLDVEDIYGRTAIELAFMYGKIYAYEILLPYYLDPTVTQTKELIEWYSQSNGSPSC